MEADNASVVAHLAKDVEGAEAPAAPAPMAPASADTLEVRVANLEAIVARLAGHL